MQSVEETDRRAQEAHRTEYLFRQQARHRHLPRQLEAFFKARDAYTAARYLHNAGSGGGGPGPGPLVERTGGGRRATGPVRGRWARSLHTAPAQSQGTACRGVDLTPGPGPALCGQI